MTKTKETGITLIALIITIIVMLILVGVTVAVALNGGLFTTAKNATNKYTVEKEKELITIGYSEYQAKKYATVDKAETDLLAKYFIGKSESDIFDENYNFINDDIISDANTSVFVLGQGIDFGNERYFWRMLYKANIYRCFLDSNEEKIESVELESTQKDLKGNSKDLELLQKYFVNLDVMDSNFIFIPNETIPDADTSLIFVGYSIKIVDDFYNGELVGKTPEVDGINVKYKNYIYRITENEENSGLLVQLESEFLNSNILEVQDANVDGNEDYGWTITFDGTGHVYTLLPDGTILEPEEPREKTDEEKLVEKYFLGENGEGIDLTTIMPDFLSNGDMTFANNEIIPDASSSMKIFNNEMIELQDENYNTTGYKLYIEYNRNIYKATTIFNYEENMLKTEGIELIYAPTGREGQTITYSYDGKKEHEEEWTILYDNGSTIEIVSPKTMGDLTIGIADDMDKTITSYNNAITDLNKYCREQITNSNKISVRSVGSNSTNPLKENTKSYTSKYLEIAGYNNREIKSPDDNWEQDVIRMLYWRITKTSDAQSYWLASRVASEFGAMTPYEQIGLFKVNGTEGNLENDYPLSMGYGSYTGARVRTNPVRPIVKIKQ